MKRLIKISATDHAGKQRIPKKGTKEDIGKTQKGKSQ